MLELDKANGTIGSIQELIELGLLDHAEKLCLSVMRSSGESAPLLNFMGVIEHRRGNGAQALVHLENAAKFEPNNLELAKNVEKVKRNLGLHSAAPLQLDSGMVDSDRPMEFTGERYVPELTGQIAYEHYHRYAFAREFAKGKKVLDVASGEGYGSALLAEYAEFVNGVDVSPEAVEHSRRHYRQVRNVEFSEGRCEKLLFDDERFDLVVSFETLEHVEGQELFLSEVKRVLAKDGVFIVSSPNKKVYSDERDFKNPYHLKELYRDELNTLLRRYFRNVYLFGQRLTFSSHIWPLETIGGVSFAHYRRSDDRLSRAAAPPFEDEYTLAVCSDGGLPTEAGASLLTSDKDELYHDFHNRGGTIQRLTDELARANSKLSANAQRTQPKPSQAKPVLEVHSVKSLGDYKKYLSERRDLFREREAYEAGLMKDQEKIHLDGICWVCGKPSQFLVDFQYAEISLAQDKSAGSRKPLWRERTVCVHCNNNNRIRAFANFVDLVLAPTKDSAIYLTEQVTSLYKYFINKYPRTIGSEFLGETTSLGAPNNRGIRNEDLTRLTFADNQFEYVFSLEVFEHIPDYEKAFREVYRVLAPGGRLVFSVPFVMDLEDNLVRAKVVDGEIRHILPPEYHGDPVNQKGSLCYRYFGWEMSADLKKAGFTDVTAYFVYSKGFAYLGNDVFFFVAEKPGDESPDRTRHLCSKETAPGLLDFPGQRGLADDATGSLNASAHGVEVEINRAEEAIGAGVYEGASTILENALARFPSNTDVLNDLSVVNILTGNLSYALKLIKEVIEIDRDNTIAIGNLTLVENAIKSQKEASVSDQEGNQVSSQVPETAYCYEKVNCPFCGSNYATSFRKSADIVRCSTCDTVYLRTRLTEEGMVQQYQKYADEGSHLSLPKSDIEIATSGLRRDYFLEEIISLTKDRGVFLDVGCAWGAFLDNARATGFKTRGIEITRLTAEFAAKTLGLDVTSQQFLDTPFDNNSVSVLSMIHVLEHLPYPKEATVKAFDILQPGGIFAGIVPNIESLSSAVQQDGWEWLQPLYHYVHYSPSTLKRHLEDAGFRIEKMYTAAGDCNRESLGDVIRTAFSPKNDKEFDNVLRAVENGGYGEEIRFFARKPESSLPLDNAVNTTDSTRLVQNDELGGVVSETMISLLGGKGINESELDKIYSKSQESIEAGNIGEAMRLLQQILAYEPANPRALNDLAVLNSIKGNVEEAIAILNKLVRLDTGNAIARKNLGSLYLRLNKVEDATRSYYAALEISPNDTEALVALASICMAIGKEDDAAILFDRVLTLDPQDPAAAAGAAALARKRLPPEGDLKETQTPSIFSPTSRSPLVSIIIPVYNKWEFTENCLESISKAVRYPNYEVLVVDNASTDGTQESMKLLSSGDRRVIYIRNESNLGFVDACNLGADRARGEYVLLLNNDTVVNDGWLESLVAFAEKTPDCGAVGSKLLYPDGRLQEAGGITFSDANGWNYGRGMNPNHPKFTFVREVDYISGASLMVRKSLWEKIGGLDRRYAPAYYEDADLCFAIRKLGYKVYYEPRSSLVHFEGATSGTNLQQGFKKYQLINRPKFAEKWEKELASQQRNDPRNVEPASSRGSTARILVVDPILPMFDRAAGSLHLFNILKVLRSLNFSITFIATNLGLFNRYKPILEEMGIETYAGDQEGMKYFGHNLVYPRVDYASLFREREFDFALIDFWYQAEYYLPLIRKYSPRTRIIIDTEDVHFVREIREAELKEDTDLKARALEKKKREIAVYGKADSVWVVTEQDRQALLDAGVITPIDIRPVIHDVPEVRNNYAAREGILFVGNFNHTPNIDAVRFFVTEVLPEVHKSLPEVVLDIVGNDPTNLTGPLASDRIHPIGYVQDISKYYEKCRLVVAPLRYGAGLKGKIVEALSHGVPVVTTSIGVEGMKLRDGQDIFVADDPAVMAAKIVDAYSRPDIWERLSTNGRSAMVSTWSFDAGRKRIEEILKPLKSNRRIPGAKSTSIVILTYNQLEYTKITIDSVRKHTKKPYEIIVIDNASSDGTVEYLKAQKDIRAIFNEENLGFPAGCNQGMEIAKGEYVVLLNNDVIVSDNWLEGLIECAESSPQIGIVGPMSNRISGYQLETNVSYRKLSQVPDFAAKYRRKNRKRWSESPRAAGFCMLIKRDLLDKIGGLDVAFGIGNCEDDDYCLRARLAGYKVAIAGDVFIHHFGSKSFGKDGLEKYKEFIRANEIIFKEKWGISPLEYWREGKNPTKTSELSLPLGIREPVPIEMLQ